MARSLVTGGAGFFGSHLVEALLEQGKSVCVFDTEEMEIPGLKESVEFIKGDIRDPQSVARACMGVDVIFHAVSLVPISKAGRKFEDVNVNGTKILLDQAVAAGVRKVVHISSSSVYGLPKKLPLREEDEPLTVGRYSRSKLLAEKIALEYGKYLDVSIIRPRAILGKRRLGIFQILFDWIAHGRRVWLLGSCENRIQFVSARDLAEACLLAAQRGQRTIYNVGAVVFGSLRKDLQALVDYAGTGSRIVSVPAAPARPVLALLDKMGLCPFTDLHYKMIDKDFYCAIDRAQKDLGWTPRDSNIDMLKESYEWYLENRSNLQGITGTTHRRPPRQGVLKILRWL